MNVFKRILLVLLIVVIAALSLVFLAWSALNIAKYFIYPDYYRNAEVVSQIPALNEGFDPQGLWYDEESGYYLHSGHHWEYAELYVVNQNGNVKKLNLVYNGNKAAQGQGGGIVRVGDYVYIYDNENQGNTINGTLYQFRFADILNAKDGDTVKAISAFETHCAMSFVFADENFIYVGEAYRAGTNYTTQKTHHYTTPDGEEHMAVIYAYARNTDGSIADAIPSLAISIPNEAQGFAVKDGVYMLSRSWDLDVSCLEFYDGYTETDQVIKLSEEASVPLVYLGKATLKETVRLPLFCNNLTLVDGGERVAITFDSASHKYIVGKFFFAYNVTSYPIPDYSK